MVEEVTPPESQIDASSFPEKVVLFKENMEFALWEIRSKIQNIKDITSSPDLVLDKAIRLARPLRILKKVCLNKHCFCFC